MPNSYSESVFEFEKGLDVDFVATLAYVKFRLRTPSKGCEETVEFNYARWVAFCVS